jgi:hypothetical protein
MLLMAWAHLQKFEDLEAVEAVVVAGPYVIAPL